MPLSIQSIENLIDLVEIKVSAMEIFNQDDARDLEKLAATWSELVTHLAERKAQRENLAIVSFNPQFQAADRVAV